MNDDHFFQEIFQNPELKIIGKRFVPGGCINTTLELKTSLGSFFVKINGEDQEDVFEKEERGLRFLSEQNQINIPKVIRRGIFDGKVYMILEWIEKGHQNDSFWNEFGKKLAQQHRVTTDIFGLDHDNYIGRLHQSNKEHSNWNEFFIEERLMPQVKLARDKQFVDFSLLNEFEALCSKLGTLIPKEVPALLHGDLWNGNFLCGPKSTPYIFDPAVYFGHRETELAFTHLFGGFDESFYLAYQEVFPLENGFSERIDIHNLYPLLVHVNLFGSSYLPGIKNTLKRFA